MKWQYRTVALSIPRGLALFTAGGQVEDEEITRALNQLGRDGWELVSAFTTACEGGATDRVVCILKRPVSA